MMKFRIPEFIKHDFLRKLVALFFAVLIWFTITNQLREFESFHEIPVIVRYPPDKISLEQRVFTADVTLRGSRRRLDDIRGGDIRVSARLPVVPEGVYHYDLRLSPANVSAPPGARVAQIEPQTIRVPLDRVVSKTVPVRVRESGALSYGYRIIEKTVMPSRVSISGPSKIVADIERVVTEAIVLDDTIVRSFEKERVNIIPIANVDINPSQVHVSYEVDKHIGQRAFTDIPVKVLARHDSGLRLKTEPPPAGVTVRGPQLALEQIQAHNIHPFIDITSITAAGRYNLPVQVWIEQAPSLVAEYIRPETINIELETVPTHAEDVEDSDDLNSESPDNNRPVRDND